MRSQDIEHRVAFQHICLGRADGRNLHEVIQDPDVVDARRLGTCGGGGQILRQLYGAAAQRVVLQHDTDVHI
jgi:hypothetical protein